MEDDSSGEEVIDSPTFVALTSPSLSPSRSVPNLLMWSQ